VLLHSVALKKHIQDSFCSLFRETGLKFEHYKTWHDVHLASSICHFETTVHEHYRNCDSSALSLDIASDAL